MDAFVFERILPIIQKRAFKKGEKLLEEGTPSEAALGRPGSRFTRVLGLPGALVSPVPNPSVVRS